MFLIYLNIKIITMKTKTSFRLPYRPAELASLAYQRMPEFSYHNFSHAKDVSRDVAILATHERVSEYGTSILNAAAWLHDIDFVIGRKDNEEVAARIAGEELRKLNLGYTSEDIQKIQELILATKMPQMPKTHLQKILCDADLYNLGGKDFFDKSEAIRSEQGLEEKGWEKYKERLDFLRNHEYHTESAKILRNPGKQRNIRIAKQIINSKGMVLFGHNIFEID